MRYIYLLLAITLFWFSLQMVTAASPWPMMCTMEYAPVCWSVQVQCIKAPCYPVRETFGNACTAAAAGATNITVGECDTVMPTPVDEDRDKYGCIGSAGYKWNPLARQCLRPWESKVRVINIAPETIPCVFGMMLTECLQIPTGNDTSSIIYGGISWFDFVPGYRYRLRVLETRLENPPADDAAINYTLLKTISKRLAPVKYNDILLWDWYMIGYNDLNINALSSVRAQDLTLSITKDRFIARICNIINGNYRVVDGVIQTSKTMSTKMACPEGLVSNIEGVWDLDGATYSIAAARQMAGATGPSIWLTITTKAGDTFTYTR